LNPFFFPERKSGFTRGTLSACVPKHKSVSSIPKKKGIYIFFLFRKRFSLSPFSFPEKKKCFSPKRKGISFFLFHECFSFFYKERKGFKERERFKERKGFADAALAASIFHYGEYSIRTVKQYLKGEGVPVRL